VIELLADLRYFCAGRNIDFGSCDMAARQQFDHDFNGGGR
jgi:hypothetical protein